MADDLGKNSSPGPFDVRTIKSLVGLMAQNDLNEIDLHDGTQRIRLRRGALKTVVAATPPPPAPTSAPAPAAPAPPAQANKPAAATAGGRNLIEIKSPTVGTFYSSPSPDAPAFVKPGSKVTNSTVVCLIEAMKIFNEINADCTGTIAEVLVENQQPVEYGQVLFKVDPAG